jgi:hypothetical protein
VQYCTCPANIHNRLWYIIYIGRWTYKQIKKSEDCKKTCIVQPMHAMWLENILCLGHNKVSRHETQKNLSFHRLQTVFSQNNIASFIHSYYPKYHCSKNNQHNQFSYYDNKYSSLLQPVSCIAFYIDLGSIIWNFHTPIRRNILRHSNIHFITWNTTST